MSQVKLEYQGRIERGRSRRVVPATLVVAGVVVVANAILLAMAGADGSWGAVWIALMIGPITNGVILLVSVMCVSLVKQRTARNGVGVYLLTAVLMPLVAIPVDFYLILSMGLHGC